MIIKKVDKRGALALSQIFILIISISTFAYFIGEEFRFVSATTDFLMEEYLMKDELTNTEIPAKYTAQERKAIEDYHIQKTGKEAIPIHPGEGGTPVSETPKKGFLGVEYGKGFLGNLAQGFMWATAAYFAIKFIGPMLGIEQAKIDAGSTAAFWGILAGKALIGAGYSQGAGLVLGGAVALVIFLALYKKESQKTITFTCLPWEAPTGGSKCEECNEQGILPCSEYQCRSLGQSCELINKGTDSEKCVYVNRNDVEYPTIEPWDDALINEEDYEYTPDDTISPPDRGVNIDYTPSTSKCMKAFTPFSFGITLDEPAMCKIDIERKKNFEDMDFFMSGGLSLYDHSYTLSLPGTAALESEGITIQNNGEYELFIRCQDANGNYNTADFVFKFCVESGPDTTAPLIMTTDPLNEHPIAYDSPPVDINVYVNEPATCKWSHTDQSYENMENDMDCSGADSMTDMNGQGLFTCTTTLTGLKNREENKFYFRCKDLHDNANIESYEYSLIGTQPLVIDWVKPEDESVIKDATEEVKVTLEARTSAGYKNGESVCWYSESCYKEDGSQAEYANVIGESKTVYTYDHKEDIWVNAGTYECSIKCIDLGGNPDYETTTFTVESDASPPIVVRALHEDTYLRLITNEPASCVYDTTYTNYPCDYSFEDGIEMKVVDDINHYTEWNSDITLYIKCEDSFGSQPAPDECSMIVRPSDNY